MHPILAQAATHPVVLAAAQQSAVSGKTAVSGGSVLLALVVGWFCFDKWWNGHITVPTALLFMLFGGLTGIAITVLGFVGRLTHAIGLT